MKKRNKTSKTKKNELEHKTRVLLEDMQSDIKKVAEGHSTIIRKLEEHDKRFVEIDQCFDRVEMIITEHTKDIKELKAGQKRIEEKLDVVTTDHEQRLQKLETI